MWCTNLNTLLNMNAKQKVIIPTDFTVASLNFVIEFLQKNTDKKNQIVFVHGYQTPESISELLFFSKTKVLKNLETPAFNDALLIIKNRFASSLDTVSFDLLTSNNKNYLNSYLQNQKADVVLQIQNYKPAFKHKNSFDLTNLYKLNTQNIYSIQNKIQFPLETQTEFTGDVFMSKA